MTARPSPPPHDALSAEERELAARLAKLDAGAGPSAALDARILGMANAAVARRRPSQRWPTAVGAAAVLVAAVGLAWQLKPMFALGPPPIAREHSGTGRAGVESDVVVQVESVPRPSPPPAAEVGDATAQVAAPAAARKAAPVAGGSVARRPEPAPRPQAKAAPPRHDEFLDEAVPPVAQATSAPAPGDARAEAHPFNAVAPPAAPAARAGGDLDRIIVSGSHASAADAGVAAPDVAADTRLAMRAWLARIRERRERGDLAGARASLERFVAAHPRVPVPRDLQTLLRDPDPWSP